MAMSKPLSPEDTPKGKLPPFEVAKAYAFSVVIGAMEKHMGKSACVLLGGDKGEFIANQLKWLRLNHLARGRNA